MFERQNINIKMASLIPGRLIIIVIYVCMYLLSFFFPFQFGSVSHELGHVLGFYHEQSRPDRDNYVTILRHNIRSGRHHNFLKYSTSEIMTDEPYDIGSVMHYGPTVCLKNKII